MTDTIGSVLGEAARRNGSKAYLRYRDEVFSYADADALARRYADGFAALGVRRGDHVALMCENRPEFLWTCFGLGRLGAVAVLINTASKGDRLAYYLNQSESSTLVVGAGFVERIGALAEPLPHLRRIVAVERSAESLSALAAFDCPASELAALVDGSAPAAAEVDVVPSDPAYILYTSGTTGPSKGVVIPHSQPLGIGRNTAAGYRYTGEDVLYTCLPLFHVNALFYTCYAALAVDATVALSPRFSAQNFWAEVKACGATEFNFMGAMANIMLRQEPSRAERDHSARLAMIVPASGELRRRVRERFGIEVVSGFGATETFLVTMTDTDHPAAKAGSAGRATDGARVRIVDENDVDVPAGQPGEILVAADDPGAMMSGYYAMPEETGLAMRGGWFHTGDRGRLDEDGYLFFIDRIKDVIRRRGENISAQEIEAILLRHPTVREAAVVPVVSELGEDDVAVFVVSEHRNTRDPVELVRYCDQEMAYFMVPRYVHFLDELPETANTRIEKYKLREWAAANRAELWDRERAGIELKR
ncbi:AMP-binding protein [Amycolatopsis sp.]|uniref:AMP-binding protein n=1 Tax=Amycolatopsis sp. TaxID=37632 RepID=UPI0026378BF4|nr:AMP-binding protein [Amycolatopsis sp.]